MANFTPTAGTPRPLGLQQTVMFRRVAVSGSNYTNAGHLNHTPVITAGRGVPTDTAPRGSIYIRIGAAGAAGSRIYVNQNGAATWAAIAGV